LRGLSSSSITLLLLFDPLNSSRGTIIQPLYRFYPSQKKIRHRSDHVFVFVCHGLKYILLPANSHVLSAVASAPTPISSSSITSPVKAEPKESLASSSASTHSNTSVSNSLAIAPHESHVVPVECKAGDVLRWQWYTSPPSSGRLASDVITLPRSII
jgi:hypothetical protein